MGRCTILLRLKLLRLKNREQSLGEQSHRRLLDMMPMIPQEGFCEVEYFAHSGFEFPHQGPVSFRRGYHAPEYSTSIPMIYTTAKAQEWNGNEHTDFYDGVYGAGSNV